MFTAARIERECPNRKSVFDRISRKRFLPPGSKEYFVANRTECEDKCVMPLLPIFYLFKKTLSIIWNVELI